MGWCDMENLKIRVNNEAESKEAQELFCTLGLNPVSISNIGFPKSLVSFNNGDFTDCHNEFHTLNGKEITIQQLRDMVVLKRNDRNDRTHTDQDGWSWFISADGKGYVFGAGNPNGLHQWDESSLDHVDLKPIEKEMNILDTGRHTMKEFLVKHNDTWTLQLLDSDTEENSFRLAVPDGAELLTQCLDDGEHFKLWWKGKSKICIGYDKDWSYLEGDVDDYMEEYPHAITLWQRHTQPEELPFVDDIKAYERKPVGRCVVSQHFTFVDDDPKSIKATLKERQSTYGSFEDVAKTTEQLFKLSVSDSFTEQQRMAMYMICSKIARLKNGDCNHKDSWHDIAGYATLIDDSL